jgi:hypothetical protein
MPAPHRTAPLAPALALALVPAVTITAVMTAVLLASHATAPWPLYAFALLANLALWFGFSPAYLVGWVDWFDPGARARIGRLGVIALAGVLWFLNLFVYTLTGTALGSLLRA